MKKPAKKGKKKRNTKKKSVAPKKNAQTHAQKTGPKPEKKQVSAAPVRPVPKPSQKPVQKKVAEPKTGSPGKVSNSIGKAGRFLREAKTELRKVKWPTRKELLASTAVVIVLTLFIALFLGLVDFGLIKIIKTVVN